MFVLVDRVASEVEPMNGDLPGPPSRLLPAFDHHFMSTRLSLDAACADPCFSVGGCSMRGKVREGYLCRAAVKAAVQAQTVGLVQGQRSDAAIVDSGGAVLR